MRNIPATIKKLAVRFYRSVAFFPVVLVLGLSGMWLGTSSVVYFSQRNNPVEVQIEGESLLLAFSSDKKWIEVYQDYTLVGEYRQGDVDYSQYQLAYTANKQGWLDVLSNLSILIFLGVLSGLIVTPVVAHRQARANSIVQFRQKWITEMREIVSSVVATAYADASFKLTMSLKEMPEQDKREAFAGFRQGVIEMQSLQAQFICHLNPNEKEHLVWKGLLEKILEKVNSNKESKGPSGMTTIIMAFANYSAEQLKREWEVTKKMM